MYIYVYIIKRERKRNKENYLIFLLFVEMKSNM